VLLGRLQELLALDLISRVEARDGYLEPLPLGEEVRAIAGIAEKAIAQASRVEELGLATSRALARRDALGQSVPIGRGHPIAALCLTWPPHLELDTLPAAHSCGCVPDAMFLLAPLRGGHICALLGAHRFSTCDVSVSPPAGRIPREKTIHLNCELGAEPAALPDVSVRGVRDNSATNRLAGALDFGVFSAWCDCASELVALSGARSSSCTPPATSIFASNYIQVFLAHLRLTCCSAGERSKEEPGGEHLIGHLHPEWISG